MLYSLFQKILGRPGFDPSLGWEDPLEKGMTTHSNIFAWRIPMDRGARKATAPGVTKIVHRLSD